MSGPDLTREDRVEPLHFEATETGSRRSYRSTVVIDRERLVEAAYDAKADRIVVTETVLTAFRTGVDPVAHPRTGLSLTIEEARALSARLAVLLTEAQSGDA